VYISHRLGEVGAVADRVVVLRDGRNAGELRKEKVSHETMVRLMVGRDVASHYVRTRRTPGEPVLEARGLRVMGSDGGPLDLMVRSGEVVALAGLVGSGRTELLHTLFGVTPPQGGSVLLEGRLLRIRSPREAMRAGLALLPEDRKQHGLVLDMSVGENIGLALFERFQRAGFLAWRALNASASDLTSRLGIRCASLTQDVELLSGGNQQKTVLAKWLGRNPRVLLLDEPTRGIDVGSKEEIYRLIDGLARDGAAILMASSDMLEVLSIADRVLVMHEGVVAGGLSHAEATEERVMSLATGARPIDRRADADGGAE
jgi:ribose transport system ATP-binding protein